MTKPLIGISSDWQENGDFSQYPHYAIRQHYSDAIEQVGGTAIILPYQSNAIEEYVDLIDGLIIPGGLFALPAEWYVEGKEQSPYDASPRTENDIKLLKAMLEEDKPVLGICAGMQLMAGIVGCKLTGNVHDYYDNSVNHWDDEPITKMSHDLIIHKDGILEPLFPSLHTQVNSHHQEAVVTLEDNVRLEAVAADNAIEAISLADKEFALGIQWHPEVNSSNKTTLDWALFDAFVKAC